MTVLATPTPYLRDGLRRLVAGLKRDAETVKLNLAEAEQDVAAARQLLAEAEAQRDRAQADADGIAKEIAFFEREAAERTPPAYDPDASLAATGLTPREDEPQHTGGNAEDCPVCRPLIDQPGGVLYPWHCTAAETDDLTAPDATHCPTCESPEPSLHPAVSGGGEVTHICDDPFHGPVPHEPAGVPVATSGPTVTMPDTGLNPDPLPPAPPSAEPRHAKDRPGLLARLTGGHRTLPDDQDGDDQ